MEFKNKFIQSLTSNTQLGPNTSLYDYLPIQVQSQDNTKKHLPYPLAVAMLQLNYPYWYECDHLDAFCIIYTESGAGSLTTCNTQNLLSPGTIAFIDCSQYHKLEIKHWPWHYHVIFLNGDPLPYFYEQFHRDQYLIHETNKFSSVPDMISSLTKKTQAGPYEDLIRAQAIFNLFSELLLEKNRITEDTAPEYLREIKHWMDTNFSSTFRLDDLEKKYNISKYRICREFARYYQESPLQYINHVRIQHAKELLLKNDYRIHEIGQLIGIENTNHFIHLFKKETGVTPLIFRKQTPVTPEP